MRFGNAVCPLVAVAASMFTKWFSDSRNLARSSDVSSAKQERKAEVDENRTWFDKLACPATTAEMRYWIR